MENISFDLNNLRLEISFKTYDELRSILSFCKKNNLYRINIPCKNNLKKEFLLNSIKLSREEFPNIDIIPHFSILYEFRRNRVNTQNYLIKFLNVVKSLGCHQVLLVSGSQKRATLDSLSALNFFKDNPLFLSDNFSLGVAFNPYLPGCKFEEEIERLTKKLQSGIVKSIWIQFGTDIQLLESRLEILKNIILSSPNINNKILDITFFGSILIPSKQFLARFKYRPWKGVYCSTEFLESVDFANKVLRKLLKTYMQYKIFPVIETKIISDDHLNTLDKLIKL
tara:strand:- start:364 stop:1209 length:846 start_codon:yes stop_codon:yes gene_type:complete